MISVCTSSESDLNKLAGFSGLLSGVSLMLIAVEDESVFGNVQVQRLSRKRKRVTFDRALEDTGFPQVPQII